MAAKNAGKGKARKKIPPRLLAQVEHDSDLRCCVCYERGRQVHHLDGDSSNSTPGNLAYLCLEHHHEATVTGGLGRKLSRQTIIKYRDDWYRVVQTRRAARTGGVEGTRGEPQPDSLFDTVLEAVMVHEVRRIGYELRRVGPNWKSVVPCVDAVAGYTSEEDYPRVQREVVRSLIEVVVQIGEGIPAEVASLLARVAAAALPVWSWGPRVVTHQHEALLHEGSRLGLSIAYDTMKMKGSTTDLRVVDAGADLLWEVLRDAVRNRHAGLRKRALDDFETVIGLARRIKFEDAVRWLEFKKADAISEGQTGRPAVLPADVAAKVWRSSKQLRPCERARASSTDIFRK